MRRLLAAMIAASLAISPIAVFGISSGMQAAHADLGWCDECSIVVFNPGTPQQTTPAPLPYLVYFH